MTTARTHRCVVRATLLVAVLVAATPGPSHAQARADTLWLDQLQRAAEQADRRGAQTSLLARQSALRLQGIRDERLPALGTVGTAQYLSDVVSVGAILPGVRIPSPAHDQYDAYITARQPLLDLTRASRVATENAQARELEARVHTATWQQRALVTDAFFGVLLRDAQLQSIDAAIAELDARARVASDRVKAGAALPSEELLLQAERGRRVQQRDELRGDRSASRQLLARLTGQVLQDDLVLAVRELPAADAISVAVADTLRARPEFAQFDRTRDVVASRRALAAAQDRPRVSAFSRAGYGRPGLNALGRSFDTYWVAGVQVEWAPWNWGRTKREQEIQVLQESIVRSDEAAFRDGITRVAAAERERQDGLRLALAADEEIIALRTRILRETRLRYDEGEVSSADYIARLTEQLNASLDRDLRRIRLQESRARYLTTLGLEVR